MRRLALLFLVSVAPACRRVPPPPAPPPPPLTAAAIPVHAAGLDGGSVAAALGEVGHRLAEAGTRLDLLEAARREVRDGGLVAIPGPPGPAGPLGPPGAEGPAGPPGPAVRLDGAPDRHEVYRRRAEQPLEPGETGAAVARCDGRRDPVVTGACAALPASVGTLVAAGAHGLDDPTLPAGWRCGYRNGSPRQRLVVRAEVYCVARGHAKAAAPPASAPRPQAP